MPPASSGHSSFSSGSVDDEEIAKPAKLALIPPDLSQSIDDLGSVESEEDLLTEPTFVFRGSASDLSLLVPDEAELANKPVVSSDIQPEFSLLAMSEGSMEPTSMSASTLRETEDESGTESESTFASCTPDFGDSEALSVTTDDTALDAELTPLPDMQSVFSLSPESEKLTVSTEIVANPAALALEPTQEEDVADSEVLNISEALARLDGDKELLGEMASLFLEEYPRFFSDIREALFRQDLQALTLTAHTIKGSVGNFAASRTAAAALHLERLGRKGSIEQASDAVARLEEELSRLKPALTDLVRLAI
jgi:HPt (histidine-containing phosphotransfer) domain-containing protein